MSYAVLFPGQGSQFVGMGADLFDARPDLLVDVADDVLGWSLREICLDGPEDRLTRTEFAQPALYALAAALWSELRPHLPEPPVAAAGHSLGEYTALTAAGVFDFAEGLRLVAVRGRAMAEAADAEPSGMAALLGADVETAEAIASGRRNDGGRLWVANVNAPGQVVLAGGDDDIDWVVDNARDLGVRRAVRLKVAGAFHSPFMDSAARTVEAVVAGLDPSPPAFPVYANATAAPVPVDRLAGLLGSQVVSPVRFEESLRAITADTGCDTFVHVGPGDVTAGMARRSIDGATALVVGDLDAVGAAAETLSTMAAPGGDE
jgi:[acyl-carrier-protein] S-malonyltransferase